MLTSGTRLGPYEILAPLGAGGMGEVYRARDTRLGREVAIKVLPGAVSADAERLARFEQEARAASALNHSSIVTIHDVGREGETAYIAMELVSGQTLRDALASGPPPLKKALQIATQLAEGLAAAHTRGIVHRDLKPENVMVTKDGAVKILDFGLAKLAVSSLEAASAMETTPRMTAEGTVLGTVGYMSPEQASGRPADFRSDQFSFGAILYELLAGKRAFARSTAAETMASIIRDEPPPLDATSPAPAPLRWLLDRCLGKDPAERFESTRDLARDLANVRDHLSETGGSTTTRMGPAPARGVRWRVPLLAAGLAAAVAAALGAGIALQVRPKEVPPPPRLVRFTVPPPDGSAFLATVETTVMAVSPDGSRLAFVATTLPRPLRAPSGIVEKGSGRFVHVRELGSIESKRLDATDGASSVFWAPDSASLGFFTASKLKRVDIKGGTAVTIADLPIGSGRSGTWSETGEILFAAIQGTTIWRVAATGGTPQPVFEADAAKGETRAFWPSFLPGGRRYVLLVRQKDRTRRLMLGEAGKPPRPVATIESAVQYVDPGYLVYVDEGQLLARRFDADSASLSGEPIAIAEHVSYFRASAQASFAVSRAGVIAYQPHESIARLAILDDTGHELGVAGSRANILNLSIGRDGRRLLYDRLEPGVGNYDIWSYDLDRGIETRITASPDTEICPLELPGGKSIVLSKSARAQPQLHRLDTATGALELLARDEGTFQLPQDISPDGTTVLYLERTAQSPFDLWTLTLAPPGKPVPFLRAPFTKWSARFSRDGRAIAFASDESGQDEAYISPFPGPGERTRVSTKGALLVRFSPDGSQLFYLTPDRRLMSVPVRTQPTITVGAAKEMFQLDGKPWTAFDVTKDGKFVAIVPEVTAGEQPLTVVAGWTPGK